MIEHGITTTKAHYWVHLFPLLKRAFWYRVSHCRAYIERHKLVETIVAAKTGSGYLIPQCAYFVSEVIVPEHYLNHVAWETLTQRESGFIGQEIALVLIEHEVVQFPTRRVASLNSRKAQLDGTDCEIRWTKNSLIEIKTECVRLGNLFVQRREQGHNVHLTKSGERRVTQFPTLFGDGDA